MAVYLDKKTNRLYIQFQYKGTTYKERLPAGTKRADATRIETKMRSDILLESHGVLTKRRDITFEAFIRDYFSPFAESRYSGDSFEKTVYVLAAAMPFFKGMPMRSIKAADIERFKTARENLPTMHGRRRMPATVARELSIISKVFSLAVKNDICDYNPYTRVEKPKFDNVQDKILRIEDEEAFFANMHSEWARDVCKMVLSTGLRQKDLMNLTRFQVDRDARLITLVQSKTTRRVIIPLNRDAMEIINRRWSGDLLFSSPVTGKETGSVRHAMQRACRRAKIPVLTIRDLRRTFATRGLENGADFATIADILGHSDLRMLPRYVRSLDMKRKLVESAASPVRFLEQKARTK